MKDPSEPSTCAAAKSPTVTPMASAPVVGAQHRHHVRGQLDAADAETAPAQWQGQAAGADAEFEDRPGARRPRPGSRPPGPPRRARRGGATWPHSQWRSSRRSSSRALPYRARAGPRRRRHLCRSRKLIGERDEHLGHRPPGRGDRGGSRDRDRGRRWAGRAQPGLRGHGGRHHRPLQPGPPLHHGVDRRLIVQGRPARVQALPALSGLQEVAHRGARARRPSSATRTGGWPRHATTSSSPDAPPRRQAACDW